MLPLKSIYITSPYGWRIHPVLKVKKFHTGVDLRANHADVLSVASGVVEYTAWRGAYGKSIMIDHGTFKSFHGHLSEYRVKQGDRVSEGQIIATSGESGTYSTGPHLHFAVYVDGKDVDPLKYLEGLMEKAKVVSSYFGTSYPAILYEGATYVMLRPFANDHYIPVTGWDPDTKTATVGGGFIENITDMVDSMKKEVK